MRLPYAFPSPLATERLQLRFMRMADVDDVFAYQSREEVCRYLTFAPRSREEVSAKVAQFSAAHVLEHDGDYWQLALDRDGRVIGDLYFTIKSREHQTGEIGWSLHPDLHGHGYMSEAARAVLRIAFEAIGLHRVVADLDTRNTASAALCRRLGMREEGHFAEDTWFKGEWADTSIYAILARELDVG